MRFSIKDIDRKGREGLENYIGGNLSKGYSLENIKAVLISSGLEKPLVNGAIRNILPGIREKELRKQKELEEKEKKQNKKEEQRKERFEKKQKASEEKQEEIKGSLFKERQNELKELQKVDTEHEKEHKLFEQKKQKKQNKKEEQRKEKFWKKQGVSEEQKKETKKTLFKERQYELKELQRVDIEQRKEQELLEQKEQRKLQKELKKQKGIEDIQRQKELEEKQKKEEKLREEQEKQKEFEKEQEEEDKKFRKVLLEERQIELKEIHEAEEKQRKKEAEENKKKEEELRKQEEKERIREEREAEKQRKLEREQKELEELTKKKALEEKKKEENELKKQREFEKEQEEKEEKIKSSLLEERQIELKELQEAEEKQRQKEAEEKQKKEQELIEQIEQERLQREKEEQERIKEEQRQRELEEEQRELEEKKRKEEERKKQEEKERKQRKRESERKQREFRKKLYSDIKPLAPIAAVLLIVLLSSLAVFRLATIGLPVLPPELITINESYDYTDAINLTLNENYEYTWNLANKGNLTSVSLSGTISKQGSSKIYLEHNDNRYLIFDSLRLSTEDIEFIDSVSEISESEPLINENKSIITRIEGGGKRTLDNIFEFKLEGDFNWSADYDKLCTKWNINDINLCYGEEECCNFIELESLGNWNNSFYLSYGRYGVGIENLVSAQIIYYDVDLDIPYSDIVISGTAEVKAEFYEERISFKDICIETCSLPTFDNDSYKLVFVIEDTNLTIDSIGYTIKKEITLTKNAPSLVKDIENITIYQYGFTKINLSEYFYDEDNDELTYYANEVDNISTTIIGSTALLVPLGNFTDKRYMYFTASDGYYNLSSNVFFVDVVEEPSLPEEVTISEVLIEPQVVINEPVRWVKIINVSDSVINLTVNISGDALNVSVIDIKENKTISDDKIKIDYENVTIDAAAYRAEKRIEQIDKTEDRLIREKEEIISEDPAAIGKIASINKELLELKNERNKLTGYVVVAKDKGLLTNFLEWVSEIEITGYAAQDKENKGRQLGRDKIKKKDYTITIDEIVKNVKVVFYTEPPTKEETVIDDTTKQIVVSSDVHYENILAYTNIKPEAKRDDIKLYRIVNDSRELVSDVNYFDENKNGLIDLIKWIVPSLSNETYQLVIKITKAEHLDENRSFIADIYDYVKEKDDNWTLINNSEYVRVTFEIPLDNTRDITIYARSNETAEIEVYKENDTELITKFENVSEESWYKVYLTNLTEGESYETFDLKISNSSVEFDYIVDPYDCPGDIHGCDYDVDPEWNFCCDNQELKEDGRITRVQFGDINNINTTCDNDGYQDFTHISTTVYRGDTETLEVDVTHDVDSGGVFSVGVWIDFYETGFDFDPLDLGYDFDCSWEDSPCTITHEIAIPSDAEPGPTVMRIIIEDSSEPPQFGPCANVGGQALFGEIEDYELIITDPGPDTTEPSFSNNKTNATATTPYNGTVVQLNLTITDTGAGVDFYRLTTNDTADGSWANESIIDANGDSSITAIFNYSIGNFSTFGGTLGWRVWANDSEGNVNISQIYTLVVQEITDVTQCRDLTKPNTVYTLTKDLTDTDYTSGNCINIQAQNITFDCQGNYIDINEDYAGVYSNQYNTTIKNCNISMGTADGGYGIYLNNADNSYIYNNTLNEQYYGLYLVGTIDSVIENITANNNTQHGIRLSSNSNNNQLNKIIVNSNTRYGIYLSSSSNNNNLTNITANSNSYSGIHLASSSNNPLTNITANNNTHHGIFLASSSNNPLTDITANSNSRDGIRLSSSSNNPLTNITANSNSYYGIYLYSNSNNNNLTDITANSNSRHGIYLASSSNNNNLTDITANSNFQYGIYLSSNSNNDINDFSVWNSSTDGTYSGIYVFESSNNIFTNGYVNKSGDYGVWLRSLNGPVASNNLFKDMWIDNTDSSDVQVNTTGAGSDVINNTFLNVSYSDAEGIDESGGPIEIIRKWYYKANVTYQNNPVEGANVSVYNVTGIWQFNLTSKADGLTDREEIIDYVNDGGTRNYYSNYTINTSKDYLFNSHGLNVTNKSQEAGFSGLIFDDIELEERTDVTLCRNLTKPNTLYTLTKDLIDADYNSGNCINIFAQNITLDCQGNYINIDQDVSGIYSNQFNTTIRNCNISMGDVGGHGIKLVDANYSFIFNNILSEQYSGLNLTHTQNTTIKNNIFESVDYGIYLFGSSNNSIIGNNLSDKRIEVVNYAIALYQDNGNLIATDNNRLINNTIDSFDRTIRLETSNRNIMIDNNLFNHQGNKGSYYFISSSNNSISGGIVNGSVKGRLVYLSSSDNNRFQDMQLFESKEENVYLTGSNINNTFLNVTYNSSKEYVASGSELIRKWYYKANVTNGTIPIEGAEIAIYNVSGNNLFNLITGADGLTNTIKIVDYVNLGDPSTGINRVYYSDYTIDTTNGSLSESHKLNVTWKTEQPGFSGLILDDIELSRDTTPPAVWFENSTTNGTITENNIFVNVTATDVGRGDNNISTFIDFNNSLVGWWRGDDYNATGVYDNSSYENFGNFSGGMSSSDIIDGKLGSAMDFNGSGSMVLIPNSESLNISGEITLSAWINMHGYPEPDMDEVINAKIVVKPSLSYSEPWEMYSLGFNSAGTYPRFIVSNRSGQIRIPNSGSQLTLNEWYHIVGVYNGTHSVIYYNGVLRDSELASEGFNLLATNNMPVSIGSRYSPGEPKDSRNSFNGSIDDVMIFDRALSKAEVLALYANTSSKHFEVNFTELVNGNYTFKAYAQDTVGNVNETEEREVNIIEPPNTPPEVTLDYPLYSDILPDTNVTFICSATDNFNLTNITLYGNWTGWKANQTKDVTGIWNSTTVSINLTDNSTYIWNCYACDNLGDCSFAPYNYSFTVDTNYIPPYTSIWVPTYAILSDGLVDVTGDVNAPGGGIADVDRDENVKINEWNNSLSDTQILRYAIAHVEIEIDSAIRGAVTYIQINKTGVFETCCSTIPNFDGNFTCDLTRNCGIYTNDQVNNLKLRTLVIDSDDKQAASTKEDYIWLDVAYKNRPTVGAIKTYDDTLTEKEVFERWDEIFINVSVTDKEGQDDIDTVLITILNTTNEVVVDNESMNKGKSITNGWVYNYSWLVPDDAYPGEWTINIYATDNSYNQNYNTTSFNVTADLIFPSINFTYPTPEDGNITENNWIPINVTANDTTNNISVFIDFDNSLVSWWRMDDVNTSGDPQDYMKRNNGTKVNDAHQVKGYLGKGFEFDGDGDYIELDYSEQLNFERNDPFTISAWIIKKGNSTGDTQAILGRYDLGSNYRGYQFMVLRDAFSQFPRNALGLDFVSSWYTDAIRVHTAQDTVLDDQWYHVAVTYNGNSTAAGFQLYIDGVDYTTTTKLNSLSATTKNNLNPRIGDGYDGDFLNGTIDDIMIFNRNLSKEEITALYANTSEKYLFHNFTDLEFGNHIFKAYAQDTAGNVNFTETRTVTINKTDFNPPKWNNNQTNLTTDNRRYDHRWFYVNWSDDRGLSSYIFSWNGTNGTWVNDTAEEMTGLINQSNVTKIINLTRGNTIGWRFYASDTSNNWNYTDVWAFVVNNSPPTRVNLSYPPNATPIMTTLPRFNWTNSTDADNDTIYYDIFIRCLEGCQDDNREAYNLTSSNYTPYPPLQYFIDDGYSYEWWVRAHDNISYSENSSKFNLSIIDRGFLVNCTSPANGSSTGNYTFNFSCYTTHSKELKNITFYGNFSWEYPENESKVLWFHFNKDSSVGENDTFIYDWSGNNNHASTNAKVFSRFGRFGGSLFFDGVNDSLIVPDSATLDFNQELSVEVWIKIIRNNFTNTSTIANNGEFMLELNFTNRTYGRLLAWINTSSGWKKVETSTAPLADGWHHIAMTYDGVTNVTRLYKNAEMVLERINEIAGPIVSTPNDLLIGISQNYSLHGIIDEFALYNSVLTEGEIRRHVYGTWQRFAFEELSGVSARTEYQINTIYRGNYTWNAYACDTSGACKWDPPPGDPDGDLTFTMNGKSMNGEFGTLSLEDNIVWIEPDPAYKGNFLDCLGDFDPGVSIIEVVWYHNGVPVFWDEWWLEEPPEVVSFYPFNEDIVRDDEWICELTLWGDAPYDEGYIISSDPLIISNSPPTVTLTYPGNEFPVGSINNPTIEDKTPTFTWEVDDIDGGAITSNLSIYCKPTCSIDNRNHLDIGTEFYNLIVPLDYSWDNDDYYQWTITAKDDRDNETVSATFEFGVSTSVVFTLITDTVNFGTVDREQTYDTEGDPPTYPPMVIQNDGTADIDIEVVAYEPLWDSAGALPTDFQYKIDEVAAEPNSYTSATTSWTPFTTGYVPVISGLKDTPENQDSAEIDIEITVPTDEDSGSKSATIIFDGSLS